MAEEAARHAKPEDIARLDAVLAEVGGNTLSMERGWRMHDRRFHTAVAETSATSCWCACVGELFDLRINPYFVQLARHTLDDHGVARRA